MRAGDVSEGIYGAVREEIVLHFWFIFDVYFIDNIYSYIIITGTIPYISYLQCVISHTLWTSFFLTGL
jgi:hypothetical protein